MILRCSVFLLFFFISAAAQATKLAEKTPSVNASQLKVVATIRPVHSLLSSIMQGVTTPVLLLGQTASVHHYSLLPSQRSTLNHADLVFWVGAALEGFLPRVLNSLPRRVKVIELINVKNITSLQPRAYNDEHVGHGHHDENIDPHIWLSVDNALAMAQSMTEILSKADPANKSIYQSNLKNLIKRLQQTKNKTLKQFKTTDFVYLVYHDAFQYFETMVKIKPLSAISNDEENAPGIRHLTQVNKLISKNKINCLIYNTYTLPAIVNTLIDQNITKIHIDPLAQKLQPGPELYFNLLDSISSGYQQCRQASK